MEVEYLYEEVYKATLEYFNNNQMLANIWLSKYAQKNNKGNFVELTPNERLHKISSEITRIEGRYQEVDWNSVEFEKTVYELLKDFKYHIPGGSILFGVGNPYFLTSLGNCLAGETKVLTRQGFLSISELKNKEVEIMTENGKWVKVPFRSYGNQKLIKISLVKNKTNKKILYATPEHKWFCSDIISNKDFICDTSSLTKGLKLKNQFGRLSKINLSPFGISHGIVFGDGETVPNQNYANNLCLCGDKRELGKYFIDSFVGSNEELCEGGADYYGCIPNYFRHKPNILENKSYLWGWLAGYFATDGCIDDRGSLMINSFKKEDLEFVQDVFGVLGLSCGEICSQTYLSNLTNKECTCYKIFFNTYGLDESFFIRSSHKNKFRKFKKSPSRWTVEGIEETDRIEEVFCCEVPETNSFVIEGNILTHNCFVVGNQTDSYGSICLIDQEQVQLMKRRGGVGHDLSHLRPNKSSVNGCASTSTGAFSFIPRYSNSTREVAQDGRRGALMLTAHINHPDIEDFIMCKDDSTKNTGCNISVKVTDDFMKSVLKEKTYNQKFPVESESVFKEVNAKPIFNKIVHQAWKNGDPGLLFWDKILQESPADCYASEGFATVSTNPCGEIPLAPYDSCRLYHINLYSYVDNPFTKEAKFNWSKFKVDTRLAVKIMDNILELEKEKIKTLIEHIETSYENKDVKEVELKLWLKVLDKLEKGRRIGIGILGEGDALAALNLFYASAEANDFAVELQKVLAVEAYTESIILAQERGAFPIWNQQTECENPYLNRIILGQISQKYPDIYKLYSKTGRRNIAMLTIAPTGTTAMFGNKHGVSSGMEPVFEVAYKRRRKINENDQNAKVDFVDEVGDKWEEYVVVHPVFKKWYEAQFEESWFDEAIVCSLEKCTWEVIQELVQRSPYYKATANEISVLSKIELQGRIQQWVDHSISITHNLPKHTTEEQIAEYYIEAWKAGCKGCTVYREGSRVGVLVREEKEEIERIFKYIKETDRPKILNCEIHKLQALKENWFIIVGLFFGLPYEIFAVKEEKFPWYLRSLTSKGTFCGEVIKRKSRIYDLITKRPDTGEPIIIEDLVSLLDNLSDRSDTRRFSLELRFGIPPIAIIETIEKQQKVITSFEKAICRVLKKYVPEGEVSGLKCENCSSTNMYYVSGCPTCKDCGNSKCG